MKPIQFKRQRLLVIFVLALAVSVALGTFLPVSTQTPTAPSPCDQLKLDIQTRAEEDAKDDRFNFFNTDKKKKKIGDILNLYKETNSKNSCFQQDDLWDFYEKEYDTHKYPSWMPFLVILLFGGVVGAAISDTLKNWVNQSLEAIGNWFYQKFAGTSLFRNIALKKYRQALIDKYQKLNIPFRPNRPLEMREVYVPLKVAGTSDRSLIQAENALQQYRRLMVKGAPGSGKSMLLKYLALSYADAEERLAILSDIAPSSLLALNRLGEERKHLYQQEWLRNLPDRPVPILLELNRLNDADLTLEKLEQKLVEVCALNVIVLHHPQK